MRIIFCSKLSPGSLVPVLILCLASRYCLAQAAPISPPSGVIYGQAIFSDTHAPARFAKVLLKAVAPADSQDDFMTVLLDSALLNMQSKSSNDYGASPYNDSELKSARSALHRFTGDLADSLLSATIDADGNYAFTGVPPGAYYIHVKAPGYVNPLAAFSPEDLASSNPTIRKKIDAAVPIVIMYDGERARTDLVAERGAAISGRIRYDDGSPAAGWSVRAIPAGANAASPLASFLGFDLTAIDPAHSNDIATTDDTGTFRLAGLQSGSFVVEARLNTAALDHSPFQPVGSTAGSFLSIVGGASVLNALKLTVYSGNVTRLSAAKSIKLDAAEEYAGADILVPLQSTYSIAGIVLAKSDGHPVNTGAVQLVAQSDTGEDDPSISLSAAINPDGTFRFDYVPGNTTYSLRAMHAADTTTLSNTKILGSLIALRKTGLTYLPATLPVFVDQSNIADLKLVVSDIVPAN
jgi:hypothetical protein